MKIAWKTIAIVLFILLLIESLMIFYFYRVGTEAIENENECVYNICSDEKYNSYYYDAYEDVCYCLTNGEIEYQRYIGK